MKVLALAAALISAASAASVASAQDAADCGSMLSAAVGMQLDSEGFDTSNVCGLTVSDLAVIKGLLDDGMNSETRGRIEKILAQQ